MNRPLTAEEATKNINIVKVNRYRVHRGEPGGNIITQLKDGLPVIENPPMALASSSSSSLPSPIQEQTEQENIIPSPLSEITYYRADLIRAFNEAASKKDRPKSKIVDQFLSAYNTGLLLPAIYKKLGPVSRSTLYVWLKAFNEGGVENLAPQSGRKGISKITEDEKNYLLTLLRNQNRIKIGSAILLTKHLLDLKHIPSPSGERTLRRYIEQFKKEHYDLWILCREGEKALNDKVLPYIERDRDLIEVGEGLVADGHRLNFQVINPFTNKPCRPSIVLFLDWRSSYPLGWEIMLEESTQCIASALRNAILTLGKIPKWLLIDNGKAFKAKVFNSSVDLKQEKLYGIFLQLGINTHFSAPYNAQAKPIERWFRTFTDWFERLQPSFTGSSINDKPAWTKRNEKLALSVRGSFIPTIFEVNEMMKIWCDFYINQPSRGLAGRKPGEIFESGRGPGVDPAKLAYLMMPIKIKTPHRNGVTLFGYHWYHEALYGYRDQVIVRYSLSDLSQIYIFTANAENEFLCVAKPVEKVHPMAFEGGTPKDIEDVKRQIAQKRSLRKQSVKLYRLLNQKSPEMFPLDVVGYEAPKLVEYLEKKSDESRIQKFISPFVDSPEPEMPVEEERPFQFASAWERYEFHLNGGVYKGPDLDKQFIEDYRSGKIAPGEYESLYGEKRLDNERETEVVNMSPFVEEVATPVLDTVNSGKEAMVIDPRNGLSRPADGILETESKRYFWYREIEDKFPGSLTDADWEFIREFEKSESWENMRWMFDLQPEEKPLEQPFKEAYERYLRLMKQELLTQEELDFIRDFRKTAPLYKTIFLNHWDDEDLEAKVVSPLGSNKHIEIGGET